MPSKYPIELILPASKWIAEAAGFRFHFSTEWNRDRFADRVGAFMMEHGAKFYAKYRVPIDLSTFFAFALYDIIERRGCFVVELSTGKEFDEWQAVTFCGVPVMRQPYEKPSEISMTK